MFINKDISEPINTRERLQESQYKFYYYPDIRKGEIYFAPWSVDIKNFLKKLYFDEVQTQVEFPGLMRAMCNGAITIYLIDHIYLNCYEIAHKYMQQLNLMEDKSFNTLVTMVYETYCLARDEGD